jgi:hypothetical protein
MSYHPDPQTDLLITATVYERDQARRERDALRAASEADKARLREVEAERDEAMSQSSWYQTRFNEVCEEKSKAVAETFEERDSLRAQLATSQQNAESDRRRLEEALREYGMHTTSCATQDSEEATCDCGLLEALAQTGEGNLPPADQNAT